MIVKLDVVLTLASSSVSYLPVIDVSSIVSKSAIVLLP